MNQKTPWLLFFDNADDPELALSKYFPKSTHGHILITTRNPDLRDYAPRSSYRIDQMGVEEAVTLLLLDQDEQENEANKEYAEAIVTVCICSLRSLDDLTSMADTRTPSSGRHPSSWIHIQSVSSC